MSNPSSIFIEENFGFFLKKEGREKLVWLTHLKKVISDQMTRMDMTSAITAPTFKQMGLTRHFQYHSTVGLNNNDVIRPGDRLRGID